VKRILYRCNCHVIISPSKFKTNL